jgi:TolA-binding protein
MNSMSKKEQRQLAQSYLQTGDELKKQEKLIDAARAYQKAIEVNPEFFQAYCKLGQVLFEQNLFQEAKQIYEKAIIIKPDNTHSYFKLGEISLQQGDFTHALNYYLKVIEYQPDSKNIYYKLQTISNRLIKQKKITNSTIEIIISCYKKAIEKSPTTLGAYVTLGRLLTQINRPNEAIYYYQSASDLQSLLLMPERNQIVNDHFKQEPNFIIIGTAKGGTTSLYQYIVDHPQIIPGIEKEIHFFSLNFALGLDWYRSHFPKLPSNSHYLTGEASPTYLDHYDAPKRLFEVNPQVRLLVLLRNPVNKTISRYYHNKNLGIESRSLNEAINTELEIINSLTDPLELIKSNKFGRTPYVLYGLYIYLLKNWLSVFSREQMLIIKSEDFYRNTDLSMEKVFSFLNLPAYKQSEYPAYTSGNYKTVDNKIKTKLSDFFIPYNRQLEEYLGMKFDWD